MKIVKGNASPQEAKAIAIALAKAQQKVARIWARPELRKEMPTKWR